MLCRLEEIKLEKTKDVETQIEGEKEEEKGEERQKQKKGKRKEGEEGIIFRMIVERIKKLNDDLHKMFVKYRTITPVAETSGNG